MADPEWAEFEQLNAKTILRPRDDFVFRFGQDFEAGLRSKVGEIVYNPTDGLIYRCIQETDAVAPDYANAAANLYWAWISGIVSGFVTNRGWYKKFADGTLIQNGTKANTTTTTTILFPISFYDATYQPVPSGADTGANYFVFNYNTKTVSQVVGRWASAPQASNTLDWVGYGRWKP